MEDGGLASQDLTCKIIGFDVEGLKGRMEKRRWEREVCFSSDMRKLERRNGTVAGLGFLKGIFWLGCIQVHAF